jgi:hypothetical protein
MIGLSSWIFVACPNVLPLGKKRDSKRVDSIIDLKKLGYFDRTEGGLAGKLNFFTTVDAKCEIHYWAVDATKADAGRATVVTLPCGNETASSEFTLTVSPLVSGSIYRLEIYAWPADTAGKAGYSPYIIEELQGGHTSFGELALPDPNQPSEILVAKIDLPLGSGFVYRHEFSEKLEQGSLEKLLDRKTGCFESRQDPEQFDGASIISRVGGISTRGFATGTGREFEGMDNRVVVEFQKGLQFGDHWEWNFRYLNNSHTISLAPIGTLSTVTVESKDIVILDRTNFDEGLRELTLDSKLPLKVSWKAANSTKNGYIIVQLGHSSLTTAVYCTFAVSAGSAIIEEKYLQKIPAGSHYLLITLEDGEILLGKENVQPNWVFNSHDWRAVKVNKL